MEKTYGARVSFRDFNETYEVKAEGDYDARIKAATLFCKEHPLHRPHNDTRRPYPIPVRPYWLVDNGYVYIDVEDKFDRRVKYG